MSSSYNFITIPDRKGDLKTIAELLRITNVGIETITTVYGDHTFDEDTSSRIFLYQENLIYRIFAVFHQYELLVNGLNDKSVVDLNRDPYNGTLESHPTIYRYSYELSSIVDSIFFHLCSVFDYLGHYISFMFVKNKDKTADWGSLAKKARSGNMDNLKSAACIRKIDSDIRIKLEWHRSQLIHKKQDFHCVGITTNLELNQLSLIFAASGKTIKYFKNIIPAYDEQSEYTLDLLPSIILYQTLKSINFLIDFLKADLISHAAFEEHVKNQVITDSPDMPNLSTKVKYCKSEQIWTDYKRQLSKFYHDYELRKNGEWV